MSHADVIIIGSGVSGLAAGARLAHAGLCVTVLEQHEKIGGYAGSFERDGYLFDTGAHHVGGLKKGDVIDRLLTDLGVRDQLEAIPSPPILARFNGGEAVPVPFELDELQRVLLDQAPSDAVAIRELIGEFKEFSAALIAGDQDVIFNCFKKWNSLSFADLLRGRVQSERAVGLLSALGPGYGGITANGSALTMASLLATYHEGAFYIKGGTHRLPELLACEIERRGGRVLTSAAAVAITAENGHITGVTCRLDGSLEHVHAPVVLSAASLRATCAMIDGHPLGDRFRTRLSQLRVGPSALRLYLSLAPGFTPPGNDIASFPVWDARRWDDDLCYHPQRHSSGRLPATLVCFPTMVDPTLAPPDAHSMFMTILAREQELIGTDPSALHERLLQIAETMTPGIRDAVLHSELATPSVFASYTRNDHGSVFGWERSPEQSLRTNALAPVGAVPGLFVAGQWGPNFGVYGGFLTAENAVKSILSKFISNA